MNWRVIDSREVKFPRMSQSLVQISGLTPVTDSSRKYKRFFERDSQDISLRCIICFRCSESILRCGSCGLLICGDCRTKFGQGSSSLNFKCKSCASGTIRLSSLKSMAPPSRQRVVEPGATRQRSFKGKRRFAKRKRRA